MLKIVFLVTSQTDKAIEVAEAWQRVGVPGVTLIEGHGLRTLQEKRAEMELPPIVSLASLMRQIDEQTTEIIFSLVEEPMVDKLIQVSEEVLGDLQQPRNGIVFVLNVERAVGLRYPRG